MLLVLTASLFACGGPARPTPAAEVSRPRPDLYDTDEEIFPDPVDRTHNRVDVLLNVSRRFARQHGRFPKPSEVAEFIPMGPRLLNDAWGRPIQFAEEAGLLMLRSAGPDGVAGTADDITGQVALDPSTIGTPTHDTDETIFSDPRQLTAARLAVARVFISDFELTHRRLPNSIEEFADPEPSPFPVSPDGWGTPMRYSLVGSDYELRSAGPDRLFQTADDIVVSREQAPAPVSNQPATRRYPP